MAPIILLYDYWTNKGVNKKKEFQEINPFRLAELEAKLEGKGSSMSNGVSGGKSAAEKVKEQGDLVRQLKADKASKEVGQCL